VGLERGTICSVVSGDMSTVDVSDWGAVGSRKSVGYGKREIKRVKESRWRVWDW